MPSVPHELLVQILREQPTVVSTLLRLAFGREVGPRPELLPTHTSVAELEPAEFRADAVLKVGDPSGQVPPAAFVVEVQLHVDEDKRFACPLYIVGLRARLRCPVTLIVVTLDEHVATWSRWCRFWFLAHAGEAVAMEIARALLEACRGLDEARRRLYTDVVLAFLDDVRRRALEIEMQLDNIDYESDLFRRVLAEGRERGLKQGREESREALAQAILGVFDARGIEVSSLVRGRIADSQDLAQLTTWLRAAITAASPDALLG